MPKHIQNILSSFKVILVCTGFFFSPSLSHSQDILTFSSGNQLLETDSYSGVSIAIGDLNADGRDDIVRYDQGNLLNIEYQTPNGGKFIHRGSPAIGNEPQWGTAIGDVNNDGLNDIIVGGSYDNLKVIMNVNGDDNYNVENLVQSSIFTQGVSLVDMDGDGALDIFACNDDADNREYLNDGTGRFTFSPNVINTTTTPRSDNSGSYSAVWSDIDIDGDLDLYISKCKAGVNDPTDPRRVNMLMVNDGEGNFSENAAAAGLDIGAQTWCTDFADLDNDGDMDAFVANHFDDCQLMLNDGQGHFTDVTASSGLFPYVSAASGAFAIQTIFRDFDNDGHVDLLFSGTKQFLFLNDGTGKFKISPNPFLSYPMESFAIGDLDHNGFLDIFAGYADVFNKPSDKKDQLFLNNGNNNNFIAVQLEGKNNNANGIGAKVEAYGAWGVQTREVRSGEGYGIMNTLTQHFGLGQATQVDKIRVIWPDGTTQEIDNPAINQFLKIVENTDCVGQACNDNNDCTINDLYDANCNCVGTYQDSDNDGICDADDICPQLPTSLFGQPCDDDNDCTIGEYWDGNCNCSGGVYTDEDNDGYCIAEDPNDNDPCVPEASDPSCGNNGPTASDPDCVIINSTSFENSDMGIWNDGGYSAKLIDHPDYSNTGTWSFYVHDNDQENSSLVSNTLNLSFYDEVKIKFSLLPFNVEGQDRMVLEGKTTGGFLIIETYLHGANVQDKTRAEFEVTLPSSMITDRTTLRFRSIGDSYSDFFVLDDIVIEGCERPTPSCAVGSPCDDGDPCTTGSVYDADCNCTNGTLEDSDNDGVCDAYDQCPGMADQMIGLSCDDGDPCTIGERYDNNCNCSGGRYEDFDNDGYCIGEDPDDNDACVPDASNTACNSDTGLRDCNIIFSTDFENPVSNGWYSGGGHARTITSTLYSNSGSTSFYVYGDYEELSSLYVGGLDNFQANALRIKFHLYAFRVESGDKLVVELVGDNEERVIKTITAGTDIENYERADLIVEVKDVNLALFNKVRFRSETDSDSDYYIMDDIVIEGCLADVTTLCIPGTVCDDGDPCTVGEMLDSDCNCNGGIFIDLDNDGYCFAFDADDNDACVPDRNSPACDDSQSTLICNEISYVDFEDGERGVWNDGGERAKLIHSVTYANSGYYTFYIQGNSGAASSIYTDNIAIADNQSVRLSFSFFPLNMENGDKFHVDIKRNGSYIPYATFTEGTDFTDAIRSSAEVLISEADLSDSAELRIRCASDQEDDYILLDDIYIEVCEAENFNSNPINGRSLINQDDLSTIEEPRLYPNPFMDQLTLELSIKDDTSENVLNIYDLKGQLIISREVTQNSTRIDLSELPDGQVYLAQLIEPGAKVHNFRLVKL